LKALNTSNVNIEIVNKLKKQVAQLISQIQIMQLLKKIKVVNVKIFNSKCFILRRYLTLINIYITIIC